MFFILLFISGKCLLEDFLGKLLQVKIFCLVYFKLSLKSWNYLIFPLTRRRPLMTLGWTAIEKGSELKSKFSILTMLDYQSGKTQSLPFLNVRNITWICFSILEIINLNSYGWIPERRWLQVEVTSIWMWKWPMYLRNNIF